MVNEDDQLKRISPTGAGIAYALAAYIWWGGIVFYFKAVAHVLPVEIIAHRAMWTAVLLVGALALSGRLKAALHTIRVSRTLAMLTATSVLIALSWYSNVWAVTHDRVLEAGLGYYIMPPVNVLLGRIFLKETLRKWQVVCVVLAFIGVIILGVSYGEVPLIALVMSISFGLYGLLRKKIPVSGTVGLAAETVILSPVAVIYILTLQHQGQLSFLSIDLTTDLLLVAAGFATALPLIWFVNAAKRLSLATLGLMTYIVPSITFLSAVLIFGEPFGIVRLASFCCVWTALLIYSLESIWWARTVKKRQATERCGLGEVEWLTGPPNVLSQPVSNVLVSELRPERGNGDVI